MRSFVGGLSLQRKLTLISMATSFAALLLASALLAPAPQEKVALKSRPKAGDRISSVEKTR